MLRATLLSTALITSLTGCARLADSRMNPLNWFGSSRPAVATNTAEQRPLVPANRVVDVVDGREMIATLNSLQVDRAPAGAIIRATGLAPRQGYYNAQLVNAGVENGTLVLQFRAQAPAGFEPEGTPESREITAAYAIDTNSLAGIRRIRVEAASNARVVSR